MLVRVLLFWGESRYQGRFRVNMMKLSITVVCSMVESEVGLIFSMLFDLKCVGM